MAEPTPSKRLPLAVIVPVRNAEAMIEECLAAVVRSNPAEIIVVDGLSTDRTVEIAQRFGAQVLSDHGRGVAAARSIGAAAATSPHVALIDVDIILPDGALAALHDELLAGGYVALQAGLESVSGDGYWGRALVSHHRSGRSRNWPGVMATIFERKVLLEFGFDHGFISGEDIELRWRLKRSGVKVGVSRRTVVTHRYEDTWEFARGQWTADGRGLARMVLKYGWRAAHLGGIPLAGAVRGIGLSLARRQPRWVPYYLCYMLFNYLAMVQIFVQRLRQRQSPSPVADESGVAGMAASTTLERESA